MTQPSLFDEISSTDEDGVRAAHRRALAHGLEITRTDAHVECHALMCVSIEQLLNVAMTAESLQGHIAMLGDPTNPLLHTQQQRLRDASASAMLLLARALDAHGVELGREPGAWQDEATRATIAVLAGGKGAPSASEVARTAMLEVSLSLLRLADSRMAVPRHLATAVGRIAAIFMLTEQLIVRGGDRGLLPDVPRGWDGLVPQGSWPYLLSALAPRERAELHSVLLGLSAATRGRVVDELLAQLEWMSFGTAMLVALFRAAGPTAPAARER